MKLRAGALFARAGPRRSQQVMVLTWRHPHPPSPPACSGHPNLRDPVAIQPPAAASLTMTKPAPLKSTHLAAGSGTGVAAGTAWGACPPLHLPLYLDWSTHLLSQLFRMLICTYSLMQSQTTEHESVSLTDWGYSESSAPPQRHRSVPLLLSPPPAATWLSTIFSGHPLPSPPLLSTPEPATQLPAARSPACRGP